MKETRMRCVWGTVCGELAMEAEDRRKTRQGVEKNCMKRMQAGLYPRFTHEMNRRWRMWTFFRLFPEMVTKIRNIPDLYAAIYFRD